MAGNQLRISKVFASLRSAYLVVGILSLVINLLMLTGPLFMLQIYDRVLSSHSVPTLVVIASFAAILYAFFGILEGIRARTLHRLSQELDAQLSNASFIATLRLPLLLGSKGSKAEPVQDLETIRRFWGGPGPAAIFDIPWMPIYIAIVFALHAWLGVLAVAGALLILGLVVANELLSREPTQNLTSTSGRRMRFLSGAKRNAEVVRALGMSASMVNRWNRFSQDYYASQSNATDTGTFFSTLIKTLRFLLQSAVLGVGAWLAIRQEVSPGTMIAASIITSRALAPVEQAVAHWRSFLASRQSRVRLDQALQAGFLDTPETELPLPTRTLTVENIATAAPGERTLTLKGASFELKSGDALAIIGPSGAGKTSLVRALVGIWPIHRGSVRLDGAEFGQWSEERLGHALGYLPQDVELFDGTVSENIARFSAEKDDQKVLEASRLAGVHELITALPEGYDTQLGEGGARLSAGQRQRVGLARALYGGPFLIVLDEPNSNLDAEGEMALTHAIKQMRAKGSIVIIVAHRPSVISAVDQVLVVKDGQQAAFGPKETVMAKLQPNTAAARTEAQTPLTVVSHD